MEKTTKIPLFRRCVIQNFPFIEEDFDALTDYGLLCKVVEYLNKVIVQTNATSTQVEELSVAFNSLKNYVDHYFDNLDVQEEINNKLDDMAEQGVLADIISQYLNSTAIFAYDNVADMKAAENLVNGSYARTLGYSAKNDGGGAFYKIREAEESETANNITTYETDNNLIAEIIDNTKELYAKKYGVKCDKVSDDTTKLQALINYAKTTGKEILLDGYAYISSTLDTKGVNIKGIGETLILGSVYVSKTYGNIGWTYLNNTGQGALITFADYVNDNLDKGSGIISDTANPIVTVTYPDRFNLQNISIIGWSRLANQIGIKNLYDTVNPPLYIHGRHNFNNVAVANCGGNGIQLTNLEMTELNNLKTMYNFGYGIYIDGQDSIDTPTEYTKFTNCKLIGNKLGGIYVNKGFNKQLTFENCEFSANGLYEELGITPPADKADAVAGITINSYKNNQNNC